MNNIGVQIYIGEKVFHQILCEIHFSELQHDSEWPWQMCEQTLNGYGHDHAECEVCIDEQDEPVYQKCRICGGESEHNWEAHYQEFISGYN